MLLMSEDKVWNSCRGELDKEKNGQISLRAQLRLEHINFLVGSVGMEI